MAIHGMLDIGTIGAFYNTPERLQPINQMSQQINAILAALAGAERIFILMDEPVETDEGNIVLVNVEKDHNEVIVESPVHTGYWAWKDVDEKVRLPILR